MRPCVFLTLVAHLWSAIAAPPGIILHVIVDDLGFGDTGYRRTSPTPGIVTPNMDALVAEGIRLDRHYVHRMCTPSRTSYLSGRLPVHVEVALPNPEDPNCGIPRNMTALPQKLKDSPAGYTTAVVGKWDMGMADYSHTPKGRGFDSSLIFFEHKNDYWTQQLAQSSCQSYGTIVDLWTHNSTTPEGPARTLNGTQYEEYIFRDRVLEILEQHDPSQGPLYLQYNPHVAHCPLQVPQDWLDRFTFPNDEAVCQAQTAVIFPGSGPADYRCRNQYNAMVALLDEIIGNITAKIKSKGWWNTTLMTLNSDNGGPIDITESGSNNWPLRGGKYSHFEGGIRANSFMSGGYLPPAVRGTTLGGIMHVADWYKTYCILGGSSEEECQSDPSASSSHLPPVDSINLWPYISGQVAESPRTEIPVELNGNSLVLIQGRYKLLRGPQDIAGWEGPIYPNASTSAHDPNDVHLACNPATGGCLFDVVGDPTEQNDIAAAHPDIVAAMAARLKELMPTFYSNNETGVDDPLCDSKPKGMPCGCYLALPGQKWNGYFGPYQV